MEGFEGMKQLETAIDSIAKDYGITTSTHVEPDNFIQREYTINFSKPVETVDGLRLWEEIVQYLNKTVKLPITLRPADAREFRKPDEIYIGVEIIKTEDVLPKNRAFWSYNRIIIKSNVKKGHEMYSAVVNALENVLIAAEACRKKYETGGEEQK